MLLVLIYHLWSVFTHSHELYKSIEKKERFYIRKEFHFHKTGLGHQHGRRLTVLGHHHGERDVM